MKSLIIFATTLFIFNFAPAKTELRTNSAIKYNGFRCVPSMRQTRLQILETQDAFELRVTNPEGYRFMPQFESGGSAFSLSFLRMQSEDLKELGEVFIFAWPKDKCRLNADHFEIQCSGEAQNKTGPIISWGLTTSRITEEIDNQTYKKRKFKLALENENTYFVNLEFYTQNCETFN